MDEKKIFWDEVKVRLRLLEINWRLLKIYWGFLKIYWGFLVFLFLAFVGGIGLVLVIVLTGVIFDDPIGHWAMANLGDMNKRDIIEFIGLGIAGILAFFGAVAVNRRAKAQVESNELVERGHIQERFKAAVEHLGSKNQSVRIASFYEFFRLASDNERLRKNIFDILRAHLRRVTTNPNYRAKVNKDKRTTEEVQCLLDVLFKSKDSQEEFVFARLKPTLLGIFLDRANLYKSCLRGATLKNMELQNANLYKADLRRTTLWKVDLQEADLREADLRDANLDQVGLSKAKLWGADLRRASLQRARLQGADLQSADLREADFYCADLQSADLQHADLRNSDLRGADLRNTKLQGVKLQGAKLLGLNLQGADLRWADLRGVFLQEVRDLDMAELSRAKVKGAVPPKGFKWPEDVDYD